MFNGETAFKLHDTYGFPLDLTADVCRERGVTVDDAAFDAAMARQKEQARAAGKFKMAANLEYAGPATTFHGYDTLEHKGNILALYKDGVSVNELDEGDIGVVVLDDTPFYAESGGQVGDRGELRSVHGIFAVEDTQKIQASVFGHHGTVKTGKLTVGNGVTARVDAAARYRTMRNHSATHLMHKALREVLGAHVQQKGSQVDADKTRFDFAHTQPLTDAEIRRVEAIVNAEILANAECQARVMSHRGCAEDRRDDAVRREIRRRSARAGHRLLARTVRRHAREAHRRHRPVQDRRGERRGGGRAARRGGDRRGRAGAGAAAGSSSCSKWPDAVKAQPQEAAARVAQILDNVKTLEKELAALKSKLAVRAGRRSASVRRVDINGVKVLAARLEGADATALRETMDKLKDKLKSAAIVLAAVGDGKVSLIAGVTADLTAKVKAGELVNMVAQQVGGKGGGRPDMAMAGGTQPEHLACCAGFWLQVTGKSGCPHVRIRSR